MRPIDDQERQQLEELHTVLQRPCQCPGKPMGHEDVYRDENGVETEGMEYIPECSAKHFGCPHVLNDIIDMLDGNVRGALELLNMKDDIPAAVALAEETIVLDRDMRIARTGDGSDELIPDIREANINAKPIEDSFIKLMKTTADPLRLKLLRAVEKALETGHV